MSKTVDKAAKSTQSLSDFRAENMAYASQSVFVNLAANLYEPWLNTKLQKRYAQTHPEQYNRPQGERYGSLTQNFAGEIAGDVGGSATLFLASSFAPKATQGFINFTGQLVHPIYHALGHAAFKDEFNEKNYTAKVDKWSLFQERNFARSLIVAAGNIAANVGAQKYVLKNPSPASVIANGKLLTTSITNALVLGARIYAPQKMKDLDTSMGKKYFSSEDEETFAKNEEKQQSEQASERRWAPPQFSSHVQRLEHQDRLEKFVEHGYRFTH